MRPLLFSLTLCAGLSAAAVAVADDVSERIEKGSVAFTGGRDFSNAVLVIVGPDEFEAEETASRGLPVYRATNSARMKDGFYQYTLTAATAEKVKIKNPVDNGRGSAARDYTLKPFSMSGSFFVKDGTIVPTDSVASKEDRDEAPE